MHFAFQDFENLYLVMDLLTGGDLRYHIAKHKHFNEEQTSNYSLYLIFYRIFYCVYHYWTFIYSFTEHYSS